MRPPGFEIFWHRFNSSYTNDCSYALQWGRRSHRILPAVIHRSQGKSIVSTSISGSWPLWNERSASTSVDCDGCAGARRRRCHRRGQCSRSLRTLSSIHHNKIRNRLGVLTPARTRQPCDPIELTWPSLRDRCLQTYLYHVPCIVRWDSSRCFAFCIEPATSVARCNISSGGRHGGALYCAGSLFSIDARPQAARAHRLTHNTTRGRRIGRSCATSPSLMFGER